MLKASTSSLLALSILAVLAGCAKKEGGEAASTAAPAAATADQSAPKDLMDGKQHPMPVAMPTAEVDLTGIAKADGGVTVAEVFADAEKLAGKTVTVRGKVVKTNAGVMGKNWVHVRDGSGAEGTNDLTATTTGDIPKVGDLVLVSGPVTANKDFGMGYVYPAIIEDAKVVVEAAGTTK